MDRSERPWAKLVPTPQFGKASTPMHDFPRRSASALTTVSQVEKLYRSHHRRLLRTARQLVPSDHAEDLVSEAFTGLLRALEGGRGPESSPSGYLARSVHHGAIRVWRQRERDAAVAVPLHTEEDMESRLVEAAVVRAAFKSLPVRWQQVLWLTVVEDWPLPKVGAAFDLTPAAAAVLAHRARIGLRRALEAAGNTLNEPLNGTLECRVSDPKQ